MTSAGELFELAWTQTWQLTALIGVVWLVTRFLARNHPHFAHALWLVVLFKCVTPPIWSSPTGVFSWIQQQTPATVDNRSSHAVIEVRAVSDREPSVAAHFLPDNAARAHRAAVPRSDMVLRRPPTTESPKDASPSANARTLAVAVWLGGAIIFFAFAVVRVGFFALRVSRHPRRSDVEVTAAVQCLAGRLGVRRLVHVVITENSVGPAVVGLLRPTILLPSQIIQGRSTVEFEPLIAHELIHVRRGDLAWSILQTAATCLWWFHPLVWIASRMVVRESERSCDEEVIAGLGCEPAVYARGLLEVLQRRHQIRSAPLFPGVRAVDIASSRLERIMTLRNRSLKRSPLWCRFMMCFMAAATLPGAAFAVPNGEETGSPSSPAASTSQESTRQRLAEEQTPVSMLGPITAGESVTALDPPDAQQVLRTLAKRGHLKDLAIPASEPGTDWKIMLEKISDSVDPPRLYPLIGRALLHHTHYACTIHLNTADGRIPSEDDPRRSSPAPTAKFSIDYQHFHLLPPQSTADRDAARSQLRKIEQQVDTLQTEVRRLLDALE